MQSASAFVYKVVAYVAVILLPDEFQKDVYKIFDYSKKIGLNGNCFSSVTFAYKACCNDSFDNDLIFLGGSNFVVSEIL